MAPHKGDPVEVWHRDRSHMTDRPYRCGYLQMMLYLSDVGEDTHCFSISPEPCDGPILEIEEQVKQRGGVHLHGPAGTVILFNLSVVHAATVRKTTHERKSVQVYYGHRDGPVLSQFTTIPTSLWRDHPDPEVRGFYSLLNTRSRKLPRCSADLPIYTRLCLLPQTVFHLCYLLDRLYPEISTDFPR